jgi:hypothetical protein
MTKFVAFKANRIRLPKVLLTAALLAAVPLSVFAKPDALQAGTVYKVASSPATSKVRLLATNKTGQFYLLLTAAQ